jgi:hypothetical protein
LEPKEVSQKIQQLKQTIEDLKTNHNKVRNQELNIDDFVKNNFIPSFNRISDSGILHNEQQDNILRIISNVSNTLQELSKAIDLGLKTDIETKTRELDYLVDKSIRAAEKQLEESTTEVGPLATATIDIAEEISSDEISSLSENLQLGPGGHYMIGRPPKNWIIKKLDGDEYMSELWRIRDKSFFKGVPGLPTKREILLLQTERDLILTPIPGKTLVEGRPLPTALEIVIPSSSLAVIPMLHAQSPFFTHTPFLHNFFRNVAPLTTTTILRAVKSSTNRNGKPFLLAEFTQEIENILVDGKEKPKAAVNFKIFAYRGQINDYLLSMRYPYMVGPNEEDLEKDLEILLWLAYNFHPVEFNDADFKEKYQEEEIEADNRFNSWKESSKIDTFKSELGVTIGRISDFEVGNYDNMKQVARMLKPFSLLWRIEKLKDEDDQVLNSVVWKEIDKALKMADNGRYSKLENLLSDFGNRGSRSSKKSLNRKKVTKKGR